MASCTSDIGTFSWKAGLLYLLLDLIPHKLAVIGSGLWLNYHWWMTDNPMQENLHLPLSRLLLHDLSKFTMNEFIPYSNHFRGPDRANPAVTQKFRSAVERHYSRNTHHYQYFEDNDFRMPLIDLVELLCDSFAANWIYNRKWPVKGEWRYIANKWDSMQLHDANKIVLAALLTELGYGTECGGIEKDSEKAKRLLTDAEYRVYQYFRNKHRS